MTRTVSGVATSITAFVGRTLRGPTDRPVIVKSFAEFTRLYGGLWLESPLSYAVSHYFLNGGRVAGVIARTTPRAASGRRRPACKRHSWASTCWATR